MWTLHSLRENLVDKMIIIEIKNSKEVAERESPMAKVIGKLAPDLIRKKVEEKVAEHLRNSFWERGIEAEISIRPSEESGMNRN